jgi:hypothetical protein
VDAAVVECDGFDAIYRVEPATNERTKSRLV